MTATRHVRRLRHGATSVYLDYGASHAVMRCEVHRLAEQVPLRGDPELGLLLVRFFRDHESCSNGSLFELDDGGSASD